MKLMRRQFLHLAASGIALPTLSRIAYAQAAYPSRPVRLIVGFAAGGTADIVARLIGQWLSEHLGQPFIIENRPGAASNIGAEIVVRSPPDGYTLLMVTATNATNATLYKKLNFNFIRDITPVARVAAIPSVVEVNPAVPANTLPEFIAYAKANPGRINFASTGNGSLQHLEGILFEMLTGVAMTHAPYKGDAPAITGLMEGETQVYFGLMPSSIEYIKAGKLRAVAVTTAKRLDELPEVPTVGEFVPGYEVTSWNGVGAPKNTPSEIVDRLNKEINAALADPKFKARLTGLDLIVHADSPAEFGKLIADETEKWTKVIRTANVKIE
jgi:tripartite-type tricarboxylate transporter receptor subunit TctC